MSNIKGGKQHLHCTLCRKVIFLIKNDHPLFFTGFVKSVALILTSDAFGEIGTPFLQTRRRHQGTGTVGHCGTQLDSGTQWDNGT